MATTPARIESLSTGTTACFELRSLRLDHAPPFCGSTTPPEVPAITVTVSVPPAENWLHDAAVWNARIRMAPGPDAVPQLPTTTLFVPDATLPRPPGMSEFSPEAVLASPPPTAEEMPEAMFWSPPATTASFALAVFA